MEIKQWAKDVSDLLDEANIIWNPDNPEEIVCYIISGKKQ
jgi:hypothetical protein